MHPVDLQEYTPYLSFTAPTLPCWPDASRRPAGAHAVSLFHRSDSPALARCIPSTCRSTRRISLSPAPTPPALTRARTRLLATRVWVPALRSHHSPAMPCTPTYHPPGVQARASVVVIRAGDPARVATPRVAEYVTARYGLAAPLSPAPTPPALTRCIPSTSLEYTPYLSFTRSDPSRADSMHPVDLAGVHAVSLFHPLRPLPR
jgi:hypothetical protein